MRNTKNLLLLILLILFNSNKSQEYIPSYRSNEEIIDSIKEDFKRNEINKNHQVQLNHKDTVTCKLTVDDIHSIKNISYYKNLKNYDKLLLLSLDSIYNELEPIDSNLVKRIDLSNNLLSFNKYSLKYSRLLSYYECLNYFGFSVVDGLGDGLGFVVHLHLFNLVGNYYGTLSVLYSWGDGGYYGSTYSRFLNDSVIQLNETRTMDGEKECSCGLEIKINKNFILNKFKIIEVKLDSTIRKYYT